LLLPGAIVGLGASSTAATLVVVWYFGLTAFALGCAYVGGGLRRGEGVLIVCAYLAFVGLILTSAYSSTVGMLLGTALPVVVGVGLGAWLLRRPGREPTARPEPGAGPRRTIESEANRSRDSS
jgi:hypothetical protein